MCTASSSCADGSPLQALACLLPFAGSCHPSRKLTADATREPTHDEVQISLQVICWPLTKFTVINFFGKDHLQLPAWIVCALTAAVSNTIQIW